VQHLRLARAFAGEVEEAAGAAAAEEAEAVAQGRGGLAEARRRDQQARRRVEAGLVEVGAHWSHSGRGSLNGSRSGRLRRRAWLARRFSAWAARVCLGAAVGLGGAGQGDRLAGAVGGVDEDQLAFHLARPGTEPRGVAVGGQLQEVVGEATEEELRFARQLEADRLDLADVHLGLRLPPLVRRGR
jgi:hypothetical protein